MSKRLFDMTGADWDAAAELLDAREPEGADWEPEEEPFDPVLESLGVWVDDRIAEGDVL